MATPTNDQVRAAFAQADPQAQAHFTGMYGDSAPFFWAAESGLIQLEGPAQAFYNLPPIAQATWYGVHGANAATAWAQAAAQTGAPSPGTPGGHGAQGQSSNPAAGTPYAPGQQPAYPGSTVVPGSGRDAGGNPSFGTTRSPFRGALRPGDYTNVLSEMDDFSGRQGSFSGSGWFDPGGNRHFIGRDDEGGPLGYGPVIPQNEAGHLALGRQDSGWDPQANNGQGAARPGNGAYYGAQPHAFTTGNAGKKANMGLPDSGIAGLNADFGSGGQGDPTDDKGAYDESPGYAAAGGQENWNKWVHSGRGGGMGGGPASLVMGPAGGPPPAPPPGAPPAQGQAPPPGAPAPGGAPQGGQGGPPPAPPDVGALPFYQTAYATGGGGGGESNTAGAPAGVGGGPTPQAQLFIGPGVNFEGDWSPLGNLVGRSDTESGLNTSGIPPQYVPLIQQGIKLGILRPTNRGWDFLKKTFNLTPQSVGGAGPALAALVGVGADGTGAGTKDYGGEVNPDRIGYGTSINAPGITNGQPNGQTPAPGTPGAPGATPTNYQFGVGTMPEGTPTPFGPIQGGLPGGFGFEWNKLIQEMQDAKAKNAIEEAKLTGKFNGLDTLAAQELAHKIDYESRMATVAELAENRQLQQQVLDEAFRRSELAYKQQKDVGYIGGQATVEQQKLLADEQERAYQRAANPARAFENEMARGATGWNAQGVDPNAIGVPGLTGVGQSLQAWGQAGGYAPGGTPAPQTVAPTGQAPNNQAPNVGQPIPTNPFAPGGAHISGPATPAQPAGQQPAAQPGMNYAGGTPGFYPTPDPSQKSGAGATPGAGATGGDQTVKIDDPGYQAPDPSQKQGAAAGATGGGQPYGVGGAFDWGAIDVRTPAAVNAFKTGTGISSTGNYGASQSYTQQAAQAAITPDQVRMQNLKMTRRLSPVARAVVGSFASAGGTDKETFDFYGKQGAPRASSSVGGYTMS